LEETYCFIIIYDGLIFIIDNSLQKDSISTYDRYAIGLYILNLLDQFLDACIAVSDLSSLFLQELSIKILILKQFFPEA
jgi:hypothetical protein